MNGFWEKWSLVGIVGSILVAGALGGCAGKGAGSMELVNVSYAPTRELYEAYNPLFENYYKEKTGKDVVVTQSHGGRESRRWKLRTGFLPTW